MALVFRFASASWCVAVAHPKHQSPSGAVVSFRPHVPAPRPSEPRRRSQVCKCASICVCVWVCVGGCECVCYSPFNPSLLLTDLTSPPPAFLPSGIHTVGSYCPPQACPPHCVCAHTQRLPSGGAPATREGLSQVRFQSERTCREGVSRKQKRDTHTHTHTPSLTPSLTHSHSHSHSHSFTHSLTPSLTHSHFLASVVLAETTLPWPRGTSPSFRRTSPTTLLASTPRSAKTKRRCGHECKNAGCPPPSFFFQQREGMRVARQLNHCSRLTSRPLLSLPLLLF